MNTKRELDRERRSLQEGKIYNVRLCGNLFARVSIRKGIGNRILLSILYFECRGEGERAVRRVLCRHIMDDQLVAYCESKLTKQIDKMLQRINKFSLDYGAYSWKNKVIAAMEKQN